MMQADLPTSISEWLSLLVQLTAVIVAVSGVLWRLLRQPLVARIEDQKKDLEHTINGLGGRVKVIEEGCMHHSTLIDKHDRAVERLDRDVASERERTARLEGQIERLVTAMEFNRDAHAQEEGEIRERLVRIETKVDALQQLPTLNRRHP